MTLAISKRSLSTGALRAAADLQLTHMPKRATQHSVSLPGFEVLPPTLKPGQASVDRHVYSEEAKEHETTYVEFDLPPKSIYSQGNMTSPDDYKNPVKPMKPGQPAEGFGHHNVSHWKSTSHSGHCFEAVAGAKAHRQHGPCYQATNPPTCVGGEMVSTTFRDDFGLHGDDPRKKVLQGSSSMPVFKSALTRGTPKATCHIPGYQGFLASNTCNPYVARIEHGEATRSNDKTNLTQQFHVNIVNYSGHIPLNPNNDKGGVKIHTRSEFGRSYRNPVAM